MLSSDASPPLLLTSRFTLFILLHRLVIFWLQSLSSPLSCSSCALGPPRPPVPLPHGEAWLLLTTTAQTEATTAAAVADAAAASGCVAFLGVGRLRFRVPALWAPRTRTPLPVAILAEGHHQLSEAPFAFLAAPFAPPPATCLPPCLLVSARPRVRSTRRGTASHVDTKRKPDPA